MKRKIWDWSALICVTLVALLFLGLTNMITKEKIKMQATQAANKALFAVFPEAVEFVDDDTLTLPEGVSCKVAKQKDGTTIGYVAQRTKQGFAGPVEVLIGVTTEGVITGLNAGGDGFSETPGIGDKVQQPAFTDLFVNLNASPATVDTIAGSTITSKAVIQGATTLYEFIMETLGLEVAAAPAAQEDTPAEESTPDTDTLLSVLPGATTVKESIIGFNDQGEIIGYAAQGTVQGFAGPVEVTIAIDSNNKIIGYSAGGKDFAETPGFGTKTQEEPFISSIVGLTSAPVIGENIDIIAGATVTSKAVIEQASILYGKLTGAEVEEKSTSSITVNGNEATGIATGFAGPVEVTISVDESGTITSYSAGGKDFAETPGFGTKTQEEPFISSIVGLTSAPVIGENIDIIAGATVTSKAVIEQVATLYNELVAP